MKKRAPGEFKERHLDEWPSINCPVELAERLEEFEDVRRTLKQKTHTLSPARRPEVRGSNQAEHFMKFDNHKTRTGNFNSDRYLDTPPSRDFDRSAPRRCYICHSLHQLSFNCPKAMKEIKREQPNSQVQSCSVTPQKGLHLKNIMLGNEIVSALIDTVSTISLISEETQSTDVTMRIILNDDIPVYLLARRLSYAEKQIVNKHVEEWLEQGIIRPSSSKYTSPIVLGEEEEWLPIVKKKRMDILDFV
ncbi:retrovirus-related Pol polyprotein from transposon 17.6 [Trichonephila clavipes]|nr:retrovirus-related Pol polyprotein from transposon 17.6 [Trichonephila clavipes]